MATGITKMATLRSDIANDNMIVLGGVRSLFTMVIDIITRKLPTAVTIQSTDNAKAVTTAGKNCSSLFSLYASSAWVEVNDDLFKTGSVE